MSEHRDCRVIGRWRIVEADLWDAEYSTLFSRRYGLSLATVTGRSRSAPSSALQVSFAKAVAFFTWSGFDEMDEVTVDSSVELLDDGTLEIEFNRHLGDEAILKAVSASSSAAC